MGRLVHFEIHASKPEQLVEFYEGVFGWTLTKWDGPMEYWMIATGPDGQAGINGGLVRRQGPAAADGQAVNAFVCTVDVDDLDATLARVDEHGGLTAVPRNAVPGIGWLAYVKDPDGNILGLMQEDTDAG